MSQRLEDKSRDRSHQRSRSNSYSDEEHDVLPVNEFEDDILDKIRNNQVIVITGETGSGKSTQIPQILERHGFLKKRGIAVSQPRRVAATNLARRVSEEMSCELGKKVGYTIRFDDCSCSETKIKYITDGCLVKECISDPLLSAYDVVMLDEAHDRSIHTDILIGLCKQIITKRPELKLIITSATLNTLHFQTFFTGSVSMEIPGRIYPVAIFHSKDIISSTQDEAIDRAVAVFQKLHRKEMGHILLFLPGQFEIEKAVRVIEEWYAIEKRHDKELHPLRVIPLYAALPAEQQTQAFQPVSSGTRKLVIATNIAETSVTVPGIRYVIDPGYTREKRFDARSGIDSLNTVKVSRVSAQQRAGRAGRTGPGKCYRLYSSDVYERMDEETVPEILRSSLLSTVLYLKVLGVDDVLSFLFLDPPSPEAISVALRQLYVLGALDDDGEVTGLGRQLSRLPLEPALGKMLLCGCEKGCEEEASVISAMMSVERVFYQVSSEQARSERGRRVMKKQKKFVSDLGDQFTYLNVYMKFISHNQDKSWCDDNGLHHRSLRTAVSITHQLRDALSSLSLSSSPRPSDIITALQHTLTNGCVLTLARRCSSDMYRTLVDLHDRGGTRVGDLHPSSALVISNSFPRYIVFQELVATNRAYFRNCCEVREEDVVNELKRIKSLKDVKLSGGSDLVFYTSKGERIETEEVIVKEKEGIISSIASKVKEKEIEAARLRYLQRKG